MKSKVTPGIMTALSIAMIGTMMISYCVIQIEASKPAVVYCFSSETFGHQEFCGWTTHKDCDKLGRATALPIYPDATKCYKT